MFPLVFWCNKLNLKTNLIVIILSFKVNGLTYVIVIMGYSLPANATLVLEDMGKVLRNIKKCRLVSMIVLCKTNKKMKNFRTYVVLKSYTYL